MQLLITIISKSKWNQELPGYLKLVSTLQTHEIIDHKLKKQSFFICITWIIAWQIFATRKENEISYISIPEISIYLFKHFCFFSFNST